MGDPGMRGDLGRAARSALTGLKKALAGVPSDASASSPSRWEKEAPDGDLLRPGDYRVVYRKEGEVVRNGLHRIHTILKTGHDYAVVAKSPVPPGVVDVPVGTIMATFRWQGSNRYAGQHGFFWEDTVERAGHGPARLTLNDNTLEMAVRGLAGERYTGLWVPV